MDPFFNRAAELFHEVLGLEPERRAEHLARACGDDVRLRAEVESLLEAHGEATGFLDHPASLGLAPQDAAPLDGRRVGAYRLEAEIARGGMGVVYRGQRDDDAFQRVVAVKLVRPGLDPALTLSRFEAERRILASLDHPNIARLLDGGSTDDGQPYFVMEYVEGEPLDTYCARRSLPVAERLRLFQTVCEAVHHAHRSLVVHRDLKPSNILVTAEGIPKLLDFGIAKVLEASDGAELAATLTAFPVLTPAYASPEQVLGQPVTTATDVYALGVVLCELLSGSLPYPVEGKPTQEILRTILEREPDRPSALCPPDRRATLTGDLDNIVQMALRKEPQRRYGSAAQLAEDVGRYLAGEPILARRPTFRYRAVKLIRRHRLAFAAAALALLGLVGGTVLATWQAHVADRHRRIAEANRAVAERRFSELRQVANYFLTEFHDLIQDLPGSTKARAALVKRMFSYLEGLARDAGSDSTLQRELAAGYEKLGDVQGSPYGKSLGDTVGARRSYRRAEAIREALFRAAPGDVSLGRDLARSRQKMGDILWVAGDYPASLERYRQAGKLREALLSRAPGDAKLLDGLRLTYDAMGDLFVPLGKTGQALEYYRRAQRLAERLLARSPRDRKARRKVATARIKVGLTLLRWGDAPGAVARMRQALSTAVALFGRAPPKRQARDVVVYAHQSLAHALHAAGHLEEAVAQHRRALVLSEMTARADPKDAWVKRDLMMQAFNIGEVLRDQGRHAAALRSSALAVELARRAARTHPKNQQFRRDLQLALAGWGRSLTHAGKWSRATAVFQEALGLVRRTLAAKPRQPEAREDLANVQEGLGRALLGAERPARAVRAFRTAIAEREKLLGRDVQNGKLRSALASAYGGLGAALAAAAAAETGAARWDQARDALRTSGRLWAKLARENRLAANDAEKARRARAALARAEAALRVRR